MSTVLWILLGLALGVAVVYFWPASKGRGRKRAPGTRSLRHRLLRLTHDAAVAKRLLDAERERHPELSELALLERVISRLERDRR